AGGGALQRAVRPVQPELATDPGPGEPPVAGQARGQPGRPVALRQAEVGLGTAGGDVPGIQAYAQAQGQRLAIRQAQATVQALAHAAAAQGQVDVGEAERFAALRLESQLAAEQGNLADYLQAID